MLLSGITVGFSYVCRVRENHGNREQFSILAHILRQHCLHQGHPARVEECCSTGADAWKKLEEGGRSVDGLSISSGLGRRSNGIGVDPCVHRGRNQNRLSGIDTDCVLRRSELSTLFRINKTFNYIAACTSRPAPVPGNQTKRNLHKVRG